jgi:hypothetical protein
MSTNEGIPISRVEAANLLLGPNAQGTEDAIKALFAEKHFTPPHDFIITPFDVLVLSQYTSLSGLKLDLSGHRIARIVNEAFAILGYPSAIVDNKTIHDYFTVLRGGRPGRRKSERIEVSSANFPDIRDRYNCLVLLKLNERSEATIPHYKKDVQYKVAKMIVQDYTNSDIRESFEGPPYPTHIVDTLILDLFEYDDEQLKQAMTNALTAYRNDYPDSALPDEFQHYLDTGKYLASAHPMLARYINYSVAELWIKILKSDSSAFNPNKSNYILKIARSYIRGGTGNANRFAKRHLRHLGYVSKQFGSFVVHLTFGIHSDKFSVFNILDTENEEPIEE